MSTKTSDPWSLYRFTHGFYCPGTLSSGQFLPGGDQALSERGQPRTRPTSSVTDLSISGSLTTDLKDTWCRRQGISRDGRRMRTEMYPQRQIHPLWLGQYEHFHCFRLCNTASISLAVNLPSELSEAPLHSTYQTNIQMYDSLGAEHTLTITWTSAAVGQWNGAISCPDATSIKQGSAPVVDPSGRIVGMITVYDIVTVIDEEAEEDILKLAKAGESDLTPC